MQTVSSLADSTTALQVADTPELAPEHIPSANQPLLIRVDSRERSSPVPALLATFPDVTLSFAALPSADYLLSDDVAVERKTASDFVASILDRRLFGQTTRMKVLFPRAMLIIEGDLSQAECRWAALCDAHTRANPMAGATTQFGQSAVCCYAQPAG
jgi:ERCC4-type nuclease